MRILVIGLDGACMDLIKPWAHEGKLPTFKKLMSEGSYGNLESVTPPLTIPAWNCLATGKNPGKIGSFSFIQKAPGSYDFQIHLHSVKKERDIWDVLSDYERKVFVLNVPNVFSAYEINGYMVAGFLCILEENLTYPKSLRNVLKEMNYERGTGYLIPSLVDSDEELSRMLMEMTESICKVLFHFMEKNWDFGFVVFQELDGAQHRFWNNKNLLLKHYQNIDKKLNKIISRLEEESEEAIVIIVSDHGFGPNKRMFLVNEWLAQEGLLKLKKKPSFVLTNALIRTIKPKNVLKILKLVRFHSLTPLYERLLRQAVKTPVIWDKTKAFSYGNWGMIYINLKGREPQGVVEEKEYEKLRTEIIEKLRRISVKAYRREEIYHGEYLDFAPDIIIQIDENVSSVSGKVGYNKIFMDGFPFPGYHDRKNGTFIAFGPDIKVNFEVKAKICDIAPTILHIFGMSIQRDTDGRVLREIFKDELATREIKYQEQEKGRIKKGIKKLRQRGIL